MTVFVATFADGEETRMSVYRDGEKLDWERGRRIANAAWQSRNRQRRYEEFLMTIQDRMPPEIVSCHFEEGNEIIRQ
jgi:hypothetical protein